MLVQVQSTVLKGDAQDTLPLKNVPGYEALLA